MSARVKLPPEMADLLRSELDAAIKESAFHRDDELIARRYLIDKWCQMDIAAELGWRRATVGDHLKHILERVKNVSAKLYIKRTQPRLGPYPAGGFLCDNIDMEDVRIKGWYTSPPSSRTPYFYTKDV